VSTPDPALVDTDVASVLYRARLFRRVVPAGLMDVVAGRPLVISVVTLGEASYGALSRKWSSRRTTEMLAFYADSFGLIELGRTVAVEYGRLRAATEALGRRRALLRS
jgi:predicted nucleic acid-binding protein